MRAIAFPLDNHKPAHSKGLWLFRGDVGVIRKSVDLSKVDALTAFNVRRDIESMRRIVEAFEKAHADAELKIALHFAMKFNPYDDDESPARLRH